MQQLIARFSILLVGILMPVVVRSQVQQASSWNGEYFEKKQGAIYFRVSLERFAGRGLEAAPIGLIEITVTNLLKKNQYLINFEPNTLEIRSRALWKLPAGKYSVSRISLVDAAGVRRSWQPGLKRDFVIKRLCISNLGLWTLTPEGRTGLGANFTMVPNSYRELGRKKDSSVVAVLDGFNGLVQEKLAGKALLNDAERNYETQRQIRVGLKFTRQIAMFYKLDLMRNNFRAKPIAAVLSAYDANFRACYTDRLEENNALRGDVRFTFILSKETGMMSKLRHTGGSADDPQLVQCVFNELKKIQFPIEDNILGELTYTYDVQ